MVARRSTLRYFPRQSRINNDSWNREPEEPVKKSKAPVAYARGSE